MSEHNMHENTERYAIWIDIAPEEIVNSSKLRSFMRQHSAYWEPRLTYGHLAYWYWEGGDDSPEDPTDVSNAQLFKSKEAAVTAMCDMGEDWKRAAVIVPITCNLGLGKSYADVLKEIE